MSYINKDDIQAGDFIVVYDGLKARYYRGVVQSDSMGRFIQTGPLTGSRKRFTLPGYRIVKREPAPEYGVSVEQTYDPGYEAEIIGLKAQLKKARYEVYHENEKGGEARGIVAEIAELVGVDLSGPRMIGETWSVDNMRRVIDVVESDHRLRNAFGNQLVKISAVLDGAL